MSQTVNCCPAALLKRAQSQTLYFGKFLRIPYNKILKNIFGQLHLQLYHENMKNMKTLPVNLSKSILNRLSSRLTVPMLSLVLIGILY